VSALGEDEIRRYARQILLPQVGGLGQERLKSSHASADDLVEALYLAGAGVGHLTVNDGEVADAVRALNPLVAVTIEPRAPGAPEGVPVATAAERALARIRQLLSLATS
jgi:adenylyltransferase/sulfurtransferase